MFWQGGGGEKEEEEKGKKFTDSKTVSISISGGATGKQVGSIDPT